MDPVKILGFAVFYFLAFNIVTIIVVQYSIGGDKAWMLYGVSIFFATIPCIYLVQGTTVLDLLLGMGAGIFGASALAYTFFGTMYASIFGAAAGGAAIGATGAASAALEGAALASAAGVGLAATVTPPPEAPESYSGVISSQVKTPFDLLGISPGTIGLSPLQKRGLMGRGRRRHRGGGLFTIPLF